MSQPESLELNATNSCPKDERFRWLPIATTSMVICFALCLRVLRIILALVKRQKRYRNSITSMRSNKRLAIRFSTVDIERGPEWHCPACDSLEEETTANSDVDSTEENQDPDFRASTTIPIKFTTEIQRNLRPECTCVDFAKKSSRFSRLNSVRKDKQSSQGNYLRIGNGQAPISHLLKREDSTTMSDIGACGEALRTWLRRNRIGLSSRHQLTLKLYCERYTTLSYSAGIIMFTVYTILCTISWIFYIIETMDCPPISMDGICYTPKMRVIAWMNFVINLFCLGYYVLRCCAATDGVRFILSYPPIIDLLVIPSALCAPFDTHRFLDVNFLRAACIFNYVDVFAYLGLIKSNRSIQTVRICFALFTMWMVGSGLMHGIVHLGDFWREDNVNQPWSYFEVSYFLLVTLSTVGYGDLVAKTTLGKLFLCIFIPVAMGVSASFLPELFRNFNRNPVTSDRYEYINGEKHVLVCGNFDNGSIRAFINGFLSGGRTKGRVRLNLVILRPIPIDLALKAILTHYHAWVRYFIGTPNNPRDLARARLNDARAAIVLATPNAKHPDTEDGANIMQAITLKARKKSLRVVLQLHNFRNKCLINNFPKWTYLFDDMVICMEELKLGLMAYNCLAPGFATLILNLLNIHGPQKQTHKPFETWRQEYEYGFQMELHDVGLSPEFDNLVLRDVVTFLYEKWNIIFLAVRCFDPVKMVIVPSDMNFVLNSSQMHVIVIAKDYSEALKIQYYCTSCMAHTTGQACICRKQKAAQKRQVKVSTEIKLFEQIGKLRNFEALNEYSTAIPMTLSRRRATTSSCYVDRLSGQRLSAVGGAISPSKIQPGLQDVSIAGKPVSVDVLPNSELISKSFATLSDAENSHLDQTGSFHWVPDVPLKKAILSPNQAVDYKFKQHVLVCVVGNPSGGPLNLENFIMPLRFHWLPIRDIVILGNCELIGQNEWTKLKNMPRIFIVDGDPCNFTDLHAVRLGFCHACVILGDAGDEMDAHAVDLGLKDRKTLLCAMNIRSLLNRELHVVHLTTELRYEKNAHLFSSVETQQHDYKLPVWLNEPFARGLIFSNSLLYSCLSSLFFNADVFRFLRVLISGQSADEIEASFAVGTGLQPALNHSVCGMPGVNVTLRGFDQPPFNMMAKEKRRKPLMFEELFLRSITCWQILCLGIYRLETRGFRYVFTNPSPRTILYAQDMFYCLTPINEKCAENL